MFFVTVYLAAKMFRLLSIVSKRLLYFDNLINTTTFCQAPFLFPGGSVFVCFDYA